MPSDLSGFVRDVDQRRAILKDLGLSSLSHHICKAADFTQQGNNQLTVLLEKDQWPLLTDTGRKLITQALQARFGASLEIDFKQSENPLPNTLAVQDEAHAATHLHQKELAMQQDKTAVILRQHFDAHFTSQPKSHP